MMKSHTNNNNNNNKATIQEQEEVSASSLPRFVTEINDNDVLMGRGFHNAEYEGNQRWQALVLARRAEYWKETSRPERHRIAQEVVQEILNRGGRFLKRIITTEEAEELEVPSRTQAWRVIHPSNSLYIKVKQLMRDVSEETRQKRKARREEMKIMSKKGPPKTDQDDYSSSQAPAQGSCAVSMREVSAPSSASSSSCDGDGESPSDYENLKMEASYSSIPQGDESRAGSLITATSTRRTATTPDTLSVQAQATQLPMNDPTVQLVEQLLTLLQQNGQSSQQAATLLLEALLMALSQGQQQPVTTTATTLGLDQLSSSSTSSSFVSQHKKPPTPPCSMPSTLNEMIPGLMSQLGGLQQQQQQQQQLPARSSSNDLLTQLSMLVQQQQPRPTLNQNLSTQLSRLLKPQQQQGLVAPATITTTTSPPYAAMTTVQPQQPPPPQAISNQHVMQPPPSTTQAPPTLMQLLEHLLGVTTPN